MFFLCFERGKYVYVPYVCALVFDFSPVSVFSDTQCSAVTAVVVVFVCRINRFLSDGWGYVLASAARWREGGGGPASREALSRPKIKTQK